MKPTPPLPPGTPSASPLPGGTGTDIYSHTLRVYWEDTDAGGVVFYANHLKFFERARTEWLRAHGVQQQALRDAEGAIFIVAETTVRYLAPARLDDLLQVSVEPLDLGRASLTLRQHSWRLPAGANAGTDGAAAPTLLAEGHIRIGCVDAGTFRPRRIPSSVLTALQTAAAPHP